MKTDKDIDLAEKKRRLIIGAAIKVIAKNGYQRSRISDIVKEAGIAHGLFYHYFPGKEDLLIGIFNNSWEAMIRYIGRINETIENPYEKIKAVIMYIFGSFEKDPELMKIMIMDVPRLEKFYNDTNQKIYHRFFVDIAEIVREGQKQGLIRNDLDGEVIAYVIHGAVDSVIRQYVYNPKYYNKEVSVKDAESQIFNILLTGISKSGKE